MITLEKTEGDRLVERFILKATGNPAPKPTESVSNAPEESSSKDSAPTQINPLNLNTASAEELAALPHIGTNTADAIVKARPYKSVEEVPQKAGLTGKPRQNWFEVARLVTI